MDTQIPASDGGDFAAYVAIPKSGKPAPGILVIQEIFGVNAVMRGIADAFAAQGYVAMCPDLFWRQQPGLQITDQSQAEWKQAFALMNGFDQAKGVEDLKSTLTALRRHPHCTGKVASVGYCLGGRLAFMMATRSDADANVSYYGVGLDSLLGETGGIRTPLLLHIAEKDEFVPPPAQAKVRDGLASRPGVTIHSYAGADHAFARIGGNHYDKTAADLANGRTAAFLRTNLA